jgi:hypothetical protein
VDFIGREGEGGGAEGEVDMKEERVGEWAYRKGSTE